MTPGRGGYASWKGWTTEEFGQYSKADSCYFELELGRSGIGSVSNLRVLEIGFGNGGFAGWVRDRGGVYAGVEALPELVDAARACGFRAHLSAAGLEAVAASGALDLVVAFDVFEHLTTDELRVELAELLDLLRAGGTLLARVPSGDSPFARAVQHGDSTHRSTIGSALVHQLAAETGYEVIAIRAPAWPISGAGPRSFLRRSGVVAARAMMYPLIRRAFMGGCEAVLAPNLVFVLRRQTLGECS